MCEGKRVPEPERRGFFRAALGLLVAWVAWPSWARAKKVAFTLDKAAELKEVGGSKLLTIKKIDFLIVRDSETTVLAFDSTCTHKACKVRYEAGARLFYCKCHKSEYNLDGTVKKGPAPRPLNRFEASLAGDRIILTLPDDYKPPAVPPPDDVDASE